MLTTDFAGNTAFDVARVLASLEQEAMAHLNEPTQKEARHVPAYWYSSLPNDAIRLITLNGLADDNRPQITLEAYPFPDAPEYNALSYAWNGEKPSRLVWCNGMQLLITKSLRRALYMLVESGSSCPLWADAICINQSDADEKGVQVPMMGVIFGQAETVFAWLGPAGPHTDIAGGAVVALEEILKNLHGSMRSSDAVLQSFGLPVKDDPIWKGLSDILRRPWFVRLWVVQEVALARSVVLCCGSNIISFNEFASLINLLKRRRLTQLVEVDGATSAGRYALRIFRRFIESKKTGRPISPIDIMQEARSHKASEHVDKVYAVLGLMGPEIRGQIDVDYSALSRREYWRTYLRMGHVLLSETSDLALLCETSSHERLAELPSWCPNFDSHTIGSELSNIGIEFMAGRSCPHTAKSAHVASSRDGLRIYLHGFIVDTVEEAIAYEGDYESSSRMRVDVGWFDKCWELSKWALGDTASATMAFIHTLSAEKINNADESWSSRDYQNCHRSLRKVLVWSKVDQEMQSSCPSEEALEDARMDDSNIHETCSGRRFITTRKSRIGIGPRSARPGDLICIFQNCKLPLILRPRENDDSFELVGEAYLYGIMRGELFEDPDLYASMQERIFIVS